VFNVSTRRKVTEMVNPSRYINPRVNRTGKTISGDSARQTQPKKSSESFEDVLNSKLDKKVKISGHAATRMKREGINLDSSQTDRLGQAVDKVEDKGGKTSLVLMDEMAMVVNVRQRTLVTVVSNQRQGDGVFTDIDSAVIAD